MTSNYKEEPLQLSAQAIQFVQLASLRYNGDDRAYRYAQASAMLQQNPQLAQADFYSALVAGNVEATTQQLQRNPQFATQIGGPLEWPALMYLTYSRVQSNQQQVLAILELLLAHGADPDSHVLFDGLYHFSALTGAMGEGERGPHDCPPHPYAEAVVNALLTAGANPNEFQGLYNTMFTEGLDRWLPTLIAHGLNAKHEVNDNNDPAETTFNFLLCQAAPAGRIKRLSLLLEHGANPNAISRYNKRSCHTNALLANQPDCAAALLQYGATVETLSIADEFRVACWNNALERADSLLKQNPTLRQDPQVFSDVAITQNFLVPWLIERGFDINSQTPDGRTLLHRLAAGNQLAHVKALIALGANPNIAEYHYRGTPLGFALHNRAWAVVDYLKDLSDDISDMCRIAYVPRVKQLLEQNPQLAQQRTPMGNTPLHLVSQARADDIDVDASSAVITLLLQHGADSKAANSEGLTPLQWYRKQGMEQMVELMQQKGVG